MGFYESLRDDTAANLIDKFGLSALLRQQVGTYNPATGAQTNVNTDTPVKILTLPMSKAKDVFREDVIESFDQFVIMSAKETAAAGISPGTDDAIVIGTKVSRIVALTPVEPGGIAVIYKIGIARA